MHARAIALYEQLWDADTICIRASGNFSCQHAMQLSFECYKALVLQGALTSNASIQDFVSSCQLHGYAGREIRAFCPIVTTCHH